MKQIISFAVLALLGLVKVTQGQTVAENLAVPKATPAKHVSTTLWSLNMCLIFYFLGSYPHSYEGEVISRGQEGNLSLEAAQEAL